MKRVVLATGLVLAALSVASVAFVYSWWDIGPCANDVRERVASPTGDVEAVVFIRNCGATVDFSTQVSILPSGAALPDRPGNVYITPHPTPVVVSWTAPDQLVVRRMVTGVTEEGQVDDVRVRFERTSAADALSWSID